MIRIHAPGLPPFPALYFDEEKRRAKTTVRHPTWHSTELALYATEFVAAVAAAVFGYVLWRVLPPVHAILYFVVLGTSFGIAWVIVSGLLRSSLPGFLARRIFPTRTVFWFIPKAMAFKSRLYTRPVIVWRMNKKRPVGLRFVLNEDGKAANYERGLSPKRTMPRGHFGDSRFLHVVIETLRDSEHSERAQSFQSMRSVPITEVDKAYADKITAVVMAAEELTDPKKSQDTDRLFEGVDIDQSF